MEQWTYHETYSGSPQGSGVSPILANIYLNELDKFMGKMKKKKKKKVLTKAIQETVKSTKTMIRYAGLIGKTQKKSGKQSAQKQT